VMIVRFLPRRAASRRYWLKRYVLWYDARVAEVENR